MGWNEFGALAGILTLGGAVLGFLWRIASTFQGMRLSLHTIATNDLPHIYGELKDMRKDFLDYIKTTKGGDIGQIEVGYTRGDREDSVGVGHYAAHDRGSFREPDDI